MFGSDTVTQVNTSITRVIDDENIPNTVNRALMRLLFQDDNLMKAFLEETWNGPAIKVDRMYDYAASGDSDVGTPDVHYVGNAPDEGEVKRAITREAGTPVTLDYVRSQALHPVHYGWAYVTDTLDHDPETNELKAIYRQAGGERIPVYLDDLVAVYKTVTEDELGPEVGVRNRFAPSPKQGFTPERPLAGSGGIGIDSPDPETEPRTSDDGNAVIVKYVWRHPENGIQKEEQRLDLSGFSGDDMYVQARARTNDTGRVIYWIYRIGEGTYPGIDALTDVEYTKPGTFFPFVFFRLNRQRVEEGFPSQAYYESTARLADYLGMDFDALNDSIHETENIDKVEQAILLMGVRTDTEDEDEIAYLHAFWERAFEKNPDPVISVERKGWNSAWADLKTNNAVVITDRDFSMVLNYGGITRRLVAGKVADDPDVMYAKEFDSFNVEYTYQTGPQNDDNTNFVTRSKEVKELVLKKQINDTFYEEIRVTEPTMKYQIWRGYNTFGRVDSDMVIIPLDKALVDELNLLEKERLYFRSMHFVFNSRVTKKLKWYETGLGKFIITVAMVAISIAVTGNPLAGLQGAIAAGAVAVALFVLKLVIGAVVTRYVTTKLVAELGLENTFIAALALTVAAMMSGYMAPGLIPLPSPSMLLSAVAALNVGVQEYVADTMSDYRREAQEFQLLMDEKEKELDKANDLLSTRFNIDPFDVVDIGPNRPRIESPDNFYQRTIHSGNIGTTAYEMVHSYVDIALTLPDTNSTLRGV